MLRLSRSTVGLAVGAALLSALAGWDRLAEERGQSPLSSFGGRAVPGVMDKGRELDGRMAAALARSRRIDEVAGDVADSRLSLLDGAARLRDIHRAAPAFAWERFRERYPGASDDERFCRLLIDRVAARSGQDRDRMRSVVARLEAEVEKRLGQGALRLLE
jgi:hypothetical protein